MTRPRIAVLAAVQAHPHSDTETIYEAVRARLPDVCRQTVYDVLHALTDVGMLRRIQPPGSLARYESRVGDTITLSAALAGSSQTLTVPSARLRA